MAMVVNSTGQSVAEEQRQQPGSSSSNGETNPNQSQVWMTMAQAWLTAFPDAKAVCTADVESWIDSNFTTLPTDLQSMPRSEIIDRLLSIQNYMRPSSQSAGAEMSKVDTTSDIPSYRFQRSDQWRPVYSWLETLDNDEVVTSNEIYNWLDSNPDIKEHLFSRHSRYHLMHYIKKCHLKILKKKEKKKQVDQTSSPIPQKSIMETKDLLPSPFISKQLMKIPRDSDLYAAKRSEALQKYEILLELEKKLMPHFSKRQKLQ